jgi:hypothetical protein
MRLRARESRRSAAARCAGTALRARCAASRSVYPAAPGSPSVRRGSRASAVAGESAGGSGA